MKGDGVTSYVRTHTHTMSTAHAPIFIYNDKSKLYRTSAKWLTMIPVWEANRVMDLQHVTDLESTITDPTTIQGIFTVAEYKDTTTQPPQSIQKLIDGQHRQEVLRRYFQKSPDAEDFSVLVRMYSVSTWEETVTLFQQINHAKPMQYRGSSTEHLHDITNVLRKEFISERGNKPVYLIRTNCVRPFLSVEHLQEAIKRYGLHERTDLPVQKFVDYAKTMNAFFAEDFSRVNARFSQTTLERATDYGFYLGLDPNCSWLLGLRAP